MGFAQPRPQTVERRAILKNTQKAVGTRLGVCKLIPYNTNIVY